MKSGKCWSPGCSIFAAAILTHALMVLVAFPATVWGAWEEDWNKTLAEAKREGQVNVYLSYDVLLPHFQKEYPEIKAVAVVGRGNDLTQRLISERRAEKYLADVISTGPRNSDFYHAKIYDPLRPALILPEVLDQSKWWMGKHIYADPNQELALIYLGVIQGGSVSYNTQAGQRHMSSNLCGTSSIRDGRGRSRRETFALRVREAAPCAFSIITPNSGRLSSGGSSQKWMSRCFAIFVRARTGSRTENLPSASAVWRLLISNKRVYRWAISA